ncbi:MAG TPA: ABC transporter permease [Micromonosporaceae bacterium]|jgi:peptide/nickel transport system permease protein
MPEPTATTTATSGTTTSGTTTTGTGPALAPGSPPPSGQLTRPVEREFTIKERSQLRQATRRFLRHRAAVVSLGVLIAMALFAFVGPLVWTHDYRFLNGPSNAKPNIHYPMGTDNLGHDVMAQVMRGTQQSIKVALLIAVLATVAGSIWGVVAGFLRGWVDSGLMRLADLILTIPGLALAAAIARSQARHASSGWWIIGIILGSLSAPYVARVVRGMVLSLREREYIEASRALGATNGRIMSRHLIPNAFAVVIVNATLLVAAGILGETALSFFGFGIQAPDTSLGLLVSAGQGAVFTRPWLFYFPGLFIIVFALSVNFVGDGLRDALDPQQTRQRR